MKKSRLYENCVESNILKRKHSRKPCRDNKYDKHFNKERHDEINTSKM